MSNLDEQVGQEEMAQVIGADGLLEAFGAVSSRPLGAGSHSYEETGGRQPRCGHETTIPTERYRRTIRGRAVSYLDVPAS